jgi:hypothetical protein
VRKTRVKWEKVIRSKTIWTNLIALIALVVQAAFGTIIAPEEQISLIILINLILRVTTSEGLFEDK